MMNFDGDDFILVYGLNIKVNFSWDFSSLCL